MSSDESSYPILDDDEFWVFDEQGNVLEAWSEIALRTHYDKEKYNISFAAFRDDFITVNWADRMTRDELTTKVMNGKYKLVIHEGCV